MTSAGGTQLNTSGRTSRLAVLSLLVAVLAVISFQAPYIALAWGIAGLVLALRSRQSLRANPRLRGARLSLLAALLSGVVIIVWAPGVILGLTAALMR